MTNSVCSISPGDDKLFLNLNIKKGIDKKIKIEGDLSNGLAKSKISDDNLGHSAVGLLKNIHQVDVKTPMVNINAEQPITIRPNTTGTEYSPMQTKLFNAFPTSGSKLYPQCTELDFTKVREQAALMNASQNLFSQNNRVITTSLSGMLNQPNANSTFLSQSALQRPQTTPNIGLSTSSTVFRPQAPHNSHNHTSSQLHNLIRLQKQQLAQQKQTSINNGQNSGQELSTNELFDSLMKDNIL